jgi:hypothetical protein
MNYPLQDRRTLRTTNQAILVVAASEWDARLWTRDYFDIPLYHHDLHLLQKDVSFEEGVYGPDDVGIVNDGQSIYLTLGW